MEPPECPKEERIFEGDVIVENAQDLEKLAGDTVLEGNLIIQGTNVENLDPLERLQQQWWRWWKRTHERGKLCPYHQRRQLVETAPSAASLRTHIWHLNSLYFGAWSFARVEVSKSKDGSTTPNDILGCFSTLLLFIRFRPLHP